MGIYILPIFCFGIVITGIVFIGVKQASDLAKQLTALAKEPEPVLNKPREASSLRGHGLIKPMPMGSVP